MSREDINTVWCCALARGVAMATVVLLTAESVAALFGVPDVAYLQRVLALVFLFTAATNPAMVLYHKRLAFSRIALQGLVAVIAEVVVVIVLAWLLHDPLALVLAIVANRAAICVLSFFIAPFRPSFGFQMSIAKELFRYGRWITGANLVQFLLNQGDNAVVGRLLGAGQLGHYQFVFNISNLPGTQITGSVGQVAFPAYVRVRDRTGSLAQAYLKVLRCVTLVALPVAGGGGG